jgi:hypothetical protein
MFRTGKFIKATAARSIPSRRQTALDPVNAADQTGQTSLTSSKRVHWSKLKTQLIKHQHFTTITTHKRSGLVKTSQTKSNLSSPVKPGNPRQAQVKPIQVNQGQSRFVSNGRPV